MDEIEIIKRQREAAEAEVIRLTLELEAAKERGDDFRTEMLGACLDQQRAEARAAELRAALETMLASAYPHPTEHPTMTEAWKVGRAAYARTPAKSLAALKARVYRERAVELRKEMAHYTSADYEQYRAALIDEADLLEERAAELEKEATK